MPEVDLRNVTHPYTCDSDQNTGRTPRRLTVDPRLRNCDSWRAVAPSGLVLAPPSSIETHQLAARIWSILEAAQQPG